VGRIRLAQVARFTVDAFPDMNFTGTVAQVRLSPQTVQNVVTYPVMLDVPNQDLKLKPGMTANVQIPVDTRRDVLRVPNAALRFKPDPADVAGGDKGKGAAPVTAESPAAGPQAGAPQAGSPQTGGRGAGGRNGSGGPGGGRGGFSGGGAGRPAAPRSGTVYVEVANGDGKGKLRPLTVRTLITDGNMTAVETSDLKEGDEIIVGLATARASAPGAPGPGGQGGPGGGRRPF
jgi:HlyD family secretion protein